MRKLLILPLLFVLGGCAAIPALQKLESFYEDISGSTVSPQNVYIAANAFDASKTLATSYFTYCRTRLSSGICNAANRRFVLKYIRSGTAARNQLETYLVAGTPAPTQIYKTLIAAVDALKTSAISQGAAQ